MGLMEETIVSCFNPRESVGKKDENLKESAIAEACSQQFNFDSILSEERNDTHATERLEQGFMQHGCPHYRRRCQIRAPCCSEVYDCRHCHNEAKNNINVEGKLRHDLPRHQVQQVVCSLCGTEQEVGQICNNCGACMGKYFCKTCKFYDDDTSKKQYHCNGCGICRYTFSQ